MTTRTVKLLRDLADFTGMRVVPKKVAERITLFKTHLPDWIANAEVLDLPPTLVDQVNAKTEALCEAFELQQAAQQAARAATQRVKNCSAELLTFGNSVITHVRVKSMRDGDHSAYLLAKLSPPAKKTPIGAPGMPTRFSSRRATSGGLLLKWHCKTPRGSVSTIYQISRRIGLTGPFEYIGGSGTKQFVDDTIPAGATTVTYHIHAMRSKTVGPTARFDVNFSGANQTPGARQRNAGPPGSVTIQTIARRTAA